MEFLSEIGLFGLKALVLVVSFIVVFLTIVLVVAKNKFKEELEVKNLNKKYKKLIELLNEKTLSKDELKEFEKSEKEKKKKEKDKDNKEKKRIYVLKFEGDIKASAVDQLRDEISAVLQVARPNKDEVILKLESPGGMVHGYGLAAAQLLRIKTAQLRLTACVDKVAASGGYMMACTADHIVSAPFAILGSIGVLAQVPNFNRLLKKNNVDYEEITAGEYKRTISLLGEITEKGRAKFKDDMEDTHVLFKEFVKSNRPQLEISKVATGEHWFGLRAKDLLLTDEIMTSDDFILKEIKEANVYDVCIPPKRSFQEKLSEAMGRMIKERVIGTIKQEQVNSIVERV